MGGELAELELTAYAGDCVVRGVLSCPDGVRLSDFLNENETILLREVRLFALEDGHEVEAGDQEIEVRDLFAIEADEGSASTANKIRTRTARVEMELGPYQVMGHVHAPTSGDPMRLVHKRKPMIPLTEATLAVAFAGKTRMRDLAAVIVNRNRASLLKPVAYERSIIDELGMLPVDPRARDTTNEIFL